MTEQHERRQSDQRLEEIHKSVKEIQHLLQGERGDNGICGRLGKAEVKMTSIQTELTEHKSGHWQSAALIIAGAGVLSTILGLLIKVISK